MKTPSISNPLFSMAIIFKKSKKRGTKTIHQPRVNKVVNKSIHIISQENTTETLLPSKKIQSKALINIPNLSSKTKIFQKKVKNISITTPNHQISANSTSLSLPIKSAQKTTSSNVIDNLLRTILLHYISTITSVPRPT